MLSELPLKSIVEAKQGLRHQIPDAMSDVMPNSTVTCADSLSSTTVMSRSLSTYGLHDGQCLQVALRVWHTDFIFDVCSTEKIISRVEQHLAICYRSPISVHRSTMLP